MNLKDLPKGLEFVDGLTTEMIVTKLDEAGIKHEKVDWDGDCWTPSRRYFRESNVGVGSKYFDKVQKVLGVPDKRNSGGHFYNARYGVTLDFDWGKISGTLTMHEGNLVEQVKITYCDCFD